ncbi:hypothetical protein [Streptomyces sp. Ac-502]|uniref:hypothetical protein n=1 Tax=Streptomyces sp. Ac-502 TaxID=3342801 RepID=UPI0038628665
MDRARFDRFLIDDGRHLLKVVIDEDASAAAGTARYRAHCSCGRMPAHTPGTGQQALAAHLAHVSTRLGPSRGPTWLPEGARIVLLILGCAALFAGSVAAAFALDQGLRLDSPASQLVRVAGVLLGYLLAAALMVAVRRYIAPTRA